MSKELVLKCKIVFEGEKIPEKLANDPYDILFIESHFDRNIQEPYLMIWYMDLGRVKMKNE